MTRDKEPKDRAEVAKWIADTTPAVATFVVGQAAQHAGADSFTAAGLGLMAGRIAAIMTPATQRRLEPFLRGLLGRTSESASHVFWDRVQAAEFAQESVFVAVDRLRSVLDPKAAEVLGRLTAQYVEAEQFPDAFFRDFAALLVEIQRDELDELEALCSKIEMLALKSDDVRLDLTMRSSGEGRVRFWEVKSGSGQVQATSILGPDYVGNGATRRLVGLIATTGLVERSARGEPTYVDIPRPSVERMARLLG